MELTEKQKKEFEKLCKPISKWLGKQFPNDTVTAIVDKHDCGYIERPVLKHVGADDKAVVNQPTDTDGVKEEGK